MPAPCKRDCGAICCARVSEVRGQALLQDGSPPVSPSTFDAEELRGQAISQPGLIFSRVSGMREKTNDPGGVAT